MKSKIKTKNLVSFLFLFISLSFNNILLAQAKETRFSIRIMEQLDFQKAKFKDATTFPYNTFEHSKSVINWGIDLLTEKAITNQLQAYIGIGYFRNKFNFTRRYDHSLLNVGTDSIPIGTSTHDYVYHLLRLPIGIGLKIMETKKINLQFVIENSFNFSFLHQYNGAKPFPDAKNKYSSFQYFGNSIIFSTQFSKTISNISSLQLEPYIRILNKYKKDSILYENNDETNFRKFDAFGVAIKYTYNHKRN